MKQTADEETLLMETAASRKVERERAKDGLVIEEAYYGNIYAPNGDVTTSNIIDVTIPLQFMVSKGELSLPRFSKSLLDGFFDPCL
eukprot:CAMPEP_0206184992 /NCGR_PEP_ID=MMETSP0166-20121206/1530_1 /ASSEMBLY_ACC=CAM_ASM_000260 /TAXON_ID=95228 /ORGANISM="Vannella robusta, Strain DIVA3 518/3/11/1/6" /LENGTH=85 /DNA_ID=CAMNT_0053600077 /DNA_START=437 /DNA_END=691 /DNA_ORIENTATION=+